MLSVRTFTSPFSLRLAQRCVVLLVCISLGMHWAVLQGVAWTGMLFSRLQSESVLEAVEKTFDGEHPCPMCLALKDAQKDEKKDSAPAAGKSLKKFEAVLVTTLRVVPPPAQIRSFPWLVSSFESRRERPLAPPPRCEVG